MTDFGPIDTSVAQAQSAQPNDLALRVQVTQLQAEVASLAQQVRERPQSRQGDDGGSQLALLELVREIRDGLNAVQSQMSDLIEAVRE